MIITVTPNPALDLTWHVESLAIGATHRADAGQARAGGKGLNVARVAHAQGADATAVTTCGGATGAEFAEELAASDVPHLLVPVAGATRRSIALVDEALGDTTIVNERGLAPTDAEWAALHDAVARALSESTSSPGASSTSGADTPDVGRIPGNSPTSGVSTPDVRPVSGGASPGVLVISGSMPPNTPDSTLASLIALGRDAGATVIVDTSGAALLAAADAGASVLKPNEHELREATGLDDPIDGARELIRRGARLVLLSLGAKGMLAISPAGSASVSPASVSPASVDCEPQDDTPDVGPDAGIGPTSGVSAPEVEPAPFAEEARSMGRADPVGILRASLGENLRGNPTGAGDAAVAACAALMDAGVHDPAMILRRATAWSAAAVLMPLAGEIHGSWPELERAVTVTEVPDPAPNPTKPTNPMSKDTA